MVTSWSQTDNPTPNRVGRLDRHDAYNKVSDLTETLREIANRDPEQEVRGTAMHVLFAVLEAAKAVVPSDPVVNAAWDGFSAEWYSEGDPVRVVDALLVAEQIE